MRYDRTRHPSFIEEAVSKHYGREHSSHVGFYFVKETTEQEQKEQTRVWHENEQHLFRIAAGIFQDEI